jgi:hypothetical protein
MPSPSYRKVELVFLNPRGGACLMMPLGFWPPKSRGPQLGPYRKHQPRFCCKATMDALGTAHQMSTVRSIGDLAPAVLIQEPIESGRALNFLSLHASFALCPVHSYVAGSGNASSCRKVRVRTPRTKMPTTNQMPPAILAGAASPHQIAVQKRNPPPGSTTSAKNLGR